MIPRFSVWSFLGLTVALVLLFVPFLFLIAASFGKEALLQFPPRGFTFSWYLKVFKTQMFIDAFKTSTVVALIAAFTALVIGIPTSYYISRMRFRGREILKAFFLSPAIVPGLVLGYALLRFYVLVGGVNLFTGLLIGHIIIVLPYTIRVSLASLANLDPTIDEAALSLGATHVRVLVDVVLPNIRAGILAAFILCFIESFNNVTVSVFLTGPGITLLPIQMLAYVEYYYDPTVAALSTLLFVFTFVIVQLTEKTLGLSSFWKM